MLTPGMKVVFFIAGMLFLQGTNVREIMSNFYQKSRGVSNKEEFKKLVYVTIADVNDYIKNNPQAEDVPEGEFHIAELYFAIEEYELAIEKMKNFLGKYPSDKNVPHGRFFLANIYMTKEDYKSAGQVLDEFIKEFPEHDGITHAIHLRAVCYTRDNQHEEAIKFLEQMIKKYEKKQLKYRIMFQLVFAYHLAEKNEEAKKILNQIKEEGNDEMMKKTAELALEEIKKIGKKVEPFSVVDIKRELFELEKHKDKVVLLFFFSIRDLSLPVLLDLIDGICKEDGSEEIKVLGICVDKDLEEEELQKLHKIYVIFQVYLEAKGLEGELTEKFGVKTVPFTVVLDKQMVIRYINVTGHELKMVLKKLYQEKGSD